MFDIIKKKAYFYIIKTLYILYNIVFSVSFNFLITMSSIILQIINLLSVGNCYNLKFVSATFSLVCFLSLNEITCQTRKNVFYFTSKALFVLEKIKF